MQQQTILLQQRENVNSKLSNVLGVSPLKKKQRPSEAPEGAVAPNPSAPPTATLMTAENLQSRSKIAFSALPIWTPIWKPSSAQSVKQNI